MVALDCFIGELAPVVGIERACRAVVTQARSGIGGCRLRDRRGDRAAGRGSGRTAHAAAAAPGGSRGRTLLHTRCFLKVYTWCIS